MSNKEEIFEIIRTHPEGLDDDDISAMTGIRPRQQVQNLCNQLALSNQIRRESVNKGAKRRKIHNFPMDELAVKDEAEVDIPEGGSWKRRLAALVAATGESEAKVLEDALLLLALKILKTHSDEDQQERDHQ
jgi:hypothetical protein